MHDLIKKPALAVLLASASLLATMPAEAALISYDFSVTIDTVTSPLFDQTFSGNFSFDDTQIPVTGFNGEDLFALQDFSFDFAGNNYSLADLFYGDAAFLGGNLLGLDALGAAFGFVPANGPFAAAFAYDFGADDSGNGSVSYSPNVGTVPEPPMAWLMIGALVVLAGLTRTTRGIHESV